MNAVEKSTEGDAVNCPECLAELPPSVSAEYADQIILLQSRLQHTETELECLKNFLRGLTDGYDKTGRTRVAAKLRTALLDASVAADRAALHGHLVDP